MPYDPNDTELPHVSMEKLRRMEPGDTVLFSPGRQKSSGQWYGMSAISEFEKVYGMRLKYRMVAVVNPRSLEATRAIWVELVAHGRGPKPFGRRKGWKKATDGKRPSPPAAPPEI